MIIIIIIRKIRIRIIIITINITMIITISHINGTTLFTFAGHNHHHQDSPPLLISNHWPVLSLVVTMIYTRESLMGLMQEKEKLEQTLKELWDVLKTVSLYVTEKEVKCCRNSYL